jgi:hypothetical protein
MLLPLPPFCGNMFCDRAKGLRPSRSCMVSPLPPSKGSVELDRKIGVCLGVSSVSRGSSSIATF